MIAKTSKGWQLTIRLSEDQLALLKRAADAEKLPTPDWVAKTALDAATRKGKR